MKLNTGPGANLANNQTHAPRLLFIDTWRLIAVVLVILSHLIGIRQQGVSSVQTGTMGYYGYPAVLIFFFISGFVVGRTCLSELRESGDFSMRGFYVRRIFRIAPPLLLYLICCSILAAMHVIDFTPYNFLGAAFYVCNTSFSNCGWYAGHTWSLAFEEQFYLLFPILFSLIELRKQRWRVLAIVIPIVLLPFFL